MIIQIVCKILAVKIFAFNSFLIVINIIIAYRFKLIALVQIYSGFPRSWKNLEKNFYGKSWKNQGKFVENWKS